MSLGDEHIARLLRVAGGVIERAARRLPAEIREAARACVTEAEIMADCMEAGEDDLDEDLLGLFEGCSLADPEPDMPGHLPRIRLFVDNLWEHAGRDMGVFREEVRITWLHELGHYLGLDEDQVAALGLA
ncbi:MAG TPA: metallopeptidase family protein [Prosthecobacter sp.]|nr:metallopeptidase family protein [Prosthecobacter sp.]HRK14529.1 metallopeptidase family protein [Prosthecobacter sp.]